MTDKVFENMFDENTNLDENELSLLYNDLRRASVTEQPVSKLRTKLKDSMKFYKITDHIKEHKRVKLSILKKENVNLNDVVKYMFAWLDYALFEYPNPFDFTGSNFDEIDNLYDIINHWDKNFNENWIDDVLLVAFSKHRGGEVRHSIKEFASYLERKEHLMKEVHDVWANQKERGNVAIINKIMCGFKFDNRDRDNAKNVKLQKDQRMLTFDYDKRKEMWEKVCDSNQFRFFTYFATLQTLLILANGDAISQENLNQLLKYGLVHYSELVMIEKTID